MDKPTSFHSETHHYLFLIPPSLSFSFTQSTTWVKRESEKIALEGSDTGTPIVLPDLRPCYVKNETHASYLTHCGEQPLPAAAAEGAPASSSSSTSSNEEETKKEEL